MHTYTHTHNHTHTNHTHSHVCRHKHYTDCSSNILHLSHIWLGSILHRGLAARSPQEESNSQIIGQLPPVFQRRQCTIPEPIQWCTTVPVLILHIVIVAEFLHKQILTTCCLCLLFDLFVCLFTGLFKVYTCREIANVFMCALV